LLAEKDALRSHPYESRKSGNHAIQDVYSGFPSIHGLWPPSKAMALKPVEGQRRMQPSVLVMRATFRFGILGLQPSRVQVFL